MTQLRFKVILIFFLFFECMAFSENFNENYNFSNCFDLSPKSFFENTKIFILDSGEGGIVLKGILEKKLELKKGNEVILVVKGKTVGWRPFNEIVEIFKSLLKRVVPLRGDHKSIFTVACNTFTVIGGEKIIRDEFGESQVFNPINLATKALKDIGSMENDKIGVMASFRSLDESHKNSYPNILKNRANGYKNVLSYPAQKLINAIEKKKSPTEIEILIMDVIERIKRSGVDHLILGCTHFSKFLDLFQKHLEGTEVNIIDTNTLVADSVTDFLLRENIAVTRSSALIPKNATYTNFKRVNPRLIQNRGNGHVENLNGINGNEFRRLPTIVLLREQRNLKVSKESQECVYFAA